MPRPFRLLTINSSPSMGGLERFQLRLAVDLADRGHDVTAVGAPGSRWSRAAAEAGLQVATRRFHAYLSPFAVLRLARIFKRLEPDLIHYRLSRNIWTIAPAARLTGRRGRVVHTLGMNPGGRLRDPVHRWLRNTLGAFVAPTPATAAKAELVWGMREGETVVIPNYAPTAPFADPALDAEAAAWRRSWGVPADTAGVLCIGTLTRLEPAKGTEEFVEAALRIAEREEGREVRFIVGGPPSPGREKWVAELEARSRDSAAAHRIIFTGAIEPQRVPAFLSALDAFVLASHRETFGLVLVEAMLAGCVVIAARGPGSDFILDGGRAGTLVPPRDPGALTEVLLDLLSGREDIWVTGPAGQEDARRRFTDEAVLDRYEHLFRSLLGTAGDEV